MNYYLLEDNLIQQQRIKSIVETCQIFDQPDSFLAAIRADKQPKIILVDLEIKTVVNAGLTVAKMIREFDILSPIIIVTTHSEMAMLSYKYQVSVLDFVNKLQNEIEFKQQLTSALTTARKHIQIQCEEETDIVALPNGKKAEHVNLSDIVYVTCSDAKSHQLTVYCEQKVIQIRATVKSLPILHQNLVRIHAAYVVNKDKLVSFDSETNMIVLSNKITLPCSRKYLKHIRKLVETKAIN